MAVAHKIMQDDSIAVATGKAKAGSEQWKVGTYYAACMDTAAIDALGTKPLQPELDAIAAIHSTSDLVRSFGSSERRGGLAPFGVNPGADPKNSNETIVSANQGGLGLPDREYYLRTDAHSQDIRREYVAHVARTLQLIGESAPQSEGDAERVMSLETALAKISMPRAAMRDPNAIYHKMSVAEFSQMTPHIDWRAISTRSVAARRRTINVRQPAYFKSLDSLIAAVPVEDWKTYLRWRAANGASNTLGAPFSAEEFRLRKVMRGVQEPQARWRTCDGATNAALGGRWDRSTSSATSRRRTGARGEDGGQPRDGAARADSGPRLDERRHEAAGDREARRLHAEGGVSGQVARLLGARRSSRASTSRTRARRRSGIASGAGHRVGKPVDRTEWSMTPPTVNASYSPSLNQIQFPAGILAAAVLRSQGRRRRELRRRWAR